MVNLKSNRIVSAMYALLLGRAQHNISLSADGSYSPEEIQRMAEAAVDMEILNLVRGTDEYIAEIDAKIAAEDKEAA